MCLIAKKINFFLNSSILGAKFYESITLKRRRKVHDGKGAYNINKMKAKIIMDKLIVE